MNPLNRPKLPGLGGAPVLRVTAGPDGMTRLPPQGTAYLKLPDPTVATSPQGTPAGRLGDHSFCPADAHGCPACPHPAIGPAILGSPNVMINDRPALRQSDPGMHSACCGPNTWTAAEGSAKVLINNKPAHRKGDRDQHCGGQGHLMQGSPDVLFG